MCVCGGGGGGGSAEGAMQQEQVKITFKNNLFSSEYVSLKRWTNTPCFLSVIRRKSRESAAGIAKVLPFTRPNFADPIPD